MQSAYQALADLLTDVSSDSRYADPSNQSRIEASLKKLSGMAHDLGSAQMLPPDADPTLRFVSGLLSEQLDRASVEFKRGNRLYAREVMRTIPGYCMSCHTRNSSGPQLGSLPLEPSSSSMSASERGEFFAATRQFDRALVEYRKVIAIDELAPAQIWSWGRALRQALVITVRVQQDPEATEAVLKTASQVKGIPSATKKDISYWLSAVASWKKEPKIKGQVSEALALSEAHRLVERAKKIQQYPMDRTGDITYLRASARVHEFLQRFPKSKKVSEGLLLAGVTHELLEDRSLSVLPEIYYEACIRQSPKTPIARDCYERLESAILFGYSGSSGAHVPADLQKRLSGLKAILKN